MGPRASMREKSRMSEMSVSRVSPEQRMVFTRSHCAGLSEAAHAAQSHLSAAMPDDQDMETVQTCMGTRGMASP